MGTIGERLTALEQSHNKLKTEVSAIRKELRGEAFASALNLAVEILKKASNLSRFKAPTEGWFDAATAGDLITQAFGVGAARVGEFCVKWNQMFQKRNGKVHLESEQEMENEVIRLRSLLSRHAEEGDGLNQDEKDVLFVLNHYKQVKDGGWGAFGHDPVGRPAKRTKSS